MTNHSDPPARLLDAARTVLDREGLEGLTLRAIAREAGVSHGAPLRHFSGLAALLTALSAQGFRDLTVEMQRFVEGAPEGAEVRLTQSGAAYIHFATSNPGVFGLMFRPELLDTSDHDFQTASAAAFGALRGLVVAAQEEGWRAGQPADHVAAMLWAHVHGVAQLWVQGALQAAIGIETLDALLDVFSRVALD